MIEHLTINLAVMDLIPITGSLDHELIMRINTEMYLFRKKKPYHYVHYGYVALFRQEVLIFFLFHNINVHVVVVSH